MMTILTSSSSRRLGQGAALAAVGCASLLCPLDWAVWRVRMATDQGMGTVALTQTTAATLKGNHFEVYSQSTTNVNCSRSLLPEAGGGPCWWLRRHPQVVTQY